MSEQKETTVKDLNDDSCLLRVVKDVPLICKIMHGRPGAGYLSKELINKMIVTMLLDKHTLTDIYLSQKAVDDINGWISDTEVDPETGCDIFKTAKTGEIFNICIYKRCCLEDDRAYGFSLIDGVVNAICAGIVDRS